MSLHGHAHGLPFDVAGALTGGGGAPAFSPSDLAGLVELTRFDLPATLRQDDAGTTAVVGDGDLIGRETEQAGVGRVYTGGGLSSIIRPKYRTNAMSGGFACASFDGTDDVLTSAGWVIAGAQTIAFDVELSSTSGTMVAMAFGNGVTTSVVFLLNQGGYQSLTVMCGSAGGASVGCGGVSGAGLTTTLERWLICFDGVNPNAASSYAIFRKGVPQTVVASGTLGLITGASIGGHPTTSFPLAGKMRKRAVWNADHRASAAPIDGWFAV